MRHSLFTIRLIAAIIIASTIMIDVSLADEPTLSAAGQQSNPPVRILLLGDSITQADYAHLSYRYWLWMKLIDTGVDFDFVGSMKSNLSGDPVWPGYMKHSFDRDHEGHWGWRTDQILNGAEGMENGKLSEWLLDYTPDIVLIHLGSNDIFEGRRYSDIFSDLKQIVETLRADNPNVIILVAKLIPTGYPVANRLIEDFNSGIDPLAAEISTPTSPVIVVDQFKDFNPAKNLFDNIHPNKRGEKKMAETWFNALMKVLESRADNKPTRPNN